MVKDEVGSEQLREFSGLKSDGSKGARQRSKQMLQSYSWKRSRQEKLSSIRAKSQLAEVFNLLIPVTSQNEQNKKDFLPVFVKSMFKMMQ